MNKPPGQSLIWRKAAVLGSLWAASEIVLGSFLHNTRVPFSGEFLTAIGIAILVAGHRLWPERGLLWRAGLVCAAMKSVSPSAVIFGPMIAISIEGLLAETGVRLFGGNTVGYLLGGGLAMSWALFQKIGTMLIFYGPDAVALYARGLERARAMAGLAPGNLSGPLLFLLGLYFISGLAASVIGLSIKHTGVDGSAKSEPAKLYRKTPHPSVSRQKYSPWALAFHALFMAAIMSAGRGIPSALMCLIAGAYAVVCACFYTRAEALLKRAGIWAGVLAVSLLAGLILGSPASGLYMALRAFVLTIGFAAIGEELMNPSIRSRLERLFGPVFFDTLEQAFDTLPAVMGAMPPGAELARSPVNSLRVAIAGLPVWLAGLNGRKIFIITGGHGSGKSELVMKLAELLRGAGKEPGGICAAGLWDEGGRLGFDLIDLSSGARVPLCRRGADGGIVSAGKFHFYAEGLAAGRSALSPENLNRTEAVFVDEIGFLELEGKGWAVSLDTLLRQYTGPLVIVTRDYLLEKVSARWELGKAVVWEAGKTSAQTAFTQMCAVIDIRQ